MWSSLSSKTVRMCVPSWAVFRSPRASPRRRLPASGRAGVLRCVGTRRQPPAPGAAGRTAAGAFSPLDGLAAQVREHGQDAAVVVLARAEPELHEDGGHVLLDGALADEEALADGLVRAALGDQREHLALAV